MGCEYALGDLCEFYRGASVPRDRMSGRGDYLYIHYGDLYRGFAYRIDVDEPQKPLPRISARERIKDTQWLKDQDIVYVLTSETVDDLGHSFLFNNPHHLDAVAGTETTIVRVARKDILVPAYLNYLMHTPHFIKLLRQYVRGMKVFRVHPDDVARIKVELPGLESQRKVVSILDVIHDKLRINQQINGYFAAMAEAKFKDLVAHDSNERKLSELVDILSGGTPKTKISQYWDGGEIPFFGPGDVKASSYVMTTEKHITQEGLDNCNSSLYPVDTVLLTARGTVGKVALAGVPMAMNQSCFGFQGKDIPQPCVYYLIKSAVRSLRAKANGATFAAINMRDLNSEVVRAPSIEVMRQFGDWSGALFASMRKGEAESNRLAALRDVLLPKLMSGEIDVSKVGLMQPNSHLSDC